MEKDRKSLNEARRPLNKAKEVRTDWIFFKCFLLEASKLEFQLDGKWKPAEKQIDLKCAFQLFKNLLQNFLDCFFYP